MRVVRVYRASCLECHDSDGRGEVGRAALPTIPDFTDSQWHARRSDAELSRSILEGKGKSMPKMKDKLGSVEVKQMVAFVRAFRGGKQVVEDEPEEPAKPSPAQPAAPANLAASHPPSVVPPPPSARQLSIREGSRSFQKYCVACHGRDGRGSRIRDNLPTIPDFTAHSWQERRNDVQLVVSVLDGKGAGMPPFRDKLGREKIRDLVAFIRTFDPSPAQPSGPALDDFEARFKKLEAEIESLRKLSQALSTADPPTQNDPSIPSTRSTPTRNEPR